MNKIKQPPLQIIPYPIGARLSDIVQFTIILTVLHIKPMKSDSELGPIWNNRKKTPTTQIRQPVKKKMMICNSIVIKSAYNQDTHRKKKNTFCLHENIFSKLRSR